MHLFRSKGTVLLLPPKYISNKNMRVINVPRRAREKSENGIYNILL